MTEYISPEEWEKHGEVVSYSMTEIMMETEMITNSIREPNPGMAPVFGEELIFSINPCFENHGHELHFSIEGASDKELFGGDWIMFGQYNPGGFPFDEDDLQEGALLGEWVVDGQETIKGTIANHYESQGKALLAGQFVQMEHPPHTEEGVAERQAIEDNAIHFLNELIDRQRRNEE